MGGIEMRFRLCLMFGFFFFESTALAHDFNYELKDREPTIEFTYPVEGQTVSPFSLDIRWRHLTYPGENLGMVIEDVETGKRTFIGDGNSLQRGSFAERLKPLNFEFKRYRIIGYHYGYDASNWTYAGIGPEFNIAPGRESFWTKWEQPEKLCPHFSGTKNYRVEAVKTITCEEENCVFPKFYWKASSYAFLEDRPIHLPEDKTIIKVSCLPN